MKVVAPKSIWDSLFILMLKFTMCYFISYELSFVLSSVNLQTLLTICEGHDGTETSNGDVLIFPDMIRYR